MKSHKYKTGRRVMNWRVGVIILTIISILVLSHYGNKDNTYVAEHEVSVYMTATVVDHPEDESIETKIRKYFKKSHVTMLAIAKAESGLKPDAINYNCWYTKDGKISTTYVKNGGRTCNVEDRKYSFGVDCFVLQAHYPGRKSCPTDVTIDEHLQEMAELSKKRSFQPWVTYNTGSYKKYLATN
jgi:hypothetical protein